MTLSSSPQPVTHDPYVSTTMNNPHPTGGGTGGGNTGGGRKRRNHHKQHQQHNNPREAAPSAVLLDDPNDLNYSVHHSHSYPAAAAAAAPYDMRRDPNQSRNRRGDIDNWQQRGEPSHSTHDRSYEDLRRNGGGRNSYDRVDRDTEGWNAVVDPYGSTTRDWQAAEEYPQQGYTSYDNAGFNSGRRGMGYDWVEDDRRLPPENGRRFVDDGARGWRDNGQQRFVSDSGWDTRFVENREAAPYVEEPRLEEPARNWEPAPGWRQNQNGRPNQHHRNQRTQQRQGDGNANQPVNFNSNNNYNRGNRQGKNKNKKWKHKDKQRGDWKQQDDQNPNKFVFHSSLFDSNVSLSPCKISAGHDVIRLRYQMRIRYHSSVGNSARDRGPPHPQTLSTLGGAPMEDGRDRDRHLQNVYDTVPVLPGTTPALSTSARSGRRTGMATINRTAKEDVFDGGPRPLCARFHRGVLVPLRVEVLGPGSDRGRCIVFQQQRTSVISTLPCRCLKPHGTAPRKTHVVDENRAAVQKSR